MSQRQTSPVRIQDVARRAGVSSATVSRVLANKPHVSDSIRQRVMAAIVELEYRPSHVARSLRTQQSRVIGLIISDIQNPFFTSLVRAVEDVAYENQYALFLCNSDEDVAKEELYVDLVYAERVAGLVIVPTCETDNPCRKMIDANIPVVTVDRRISNLAVDSVVVDNVRAAFEIVQLLIQDGHRRIACIAGPATTTTGRERRAGYVQALRAHSLPVLTDLIRTGPPREEFGYQVASELLGRPERPTALFAGNNLLTVGALRAIEEAGLRVPDDIAIGAFDSLNWMPYIGPELLVAAQPAYDMGWTAADLLMKRIADKARPIQTVVYSPTITRTRTSRGELTAYPKTGPSTHSPSVPAAPKGSREGPSAPGSEPGFRIHNE